MDLHLILAPGHAPEFATVETESKRIARERGGAARPIIVPDTKIRFVPFMNDLLAEIHAKGVTRPRTEPRPIFHHEHDTSALSDTRAERDLAAMDAPGTNVEAIVETILKAKGYALGRFAKAVAVRFEKMGG